MPRQARVIIPNTPHHIIQRSHNRQVVFASDDDYIYYKDKAIDYDRLYLALDNTEKERQTAYEVYLTETVPEFELKLIRQAIQRGQLTGGEKFRVKVEKKLGIRISNRGQGRPRKAGK